MILTVKRRQGKILEAQTRSLSISFALQEFAEASSLRLLCYNFAALLKSCISLICTYKQQWYLFLRGIPNKSKEGKLITTFYHGKKVGLFWLQAIWTNKHNLSIDDHIEKFLGFWKHIPKVTNDTLETNFFKGLHETLRYQVKGLGCIDFLDGVAKAKIYENMEKFN